MEKSRVKVKKLDWAAIWDEALGEDEDTSSEELVIETQYPACQPSTSLGTPWPPCRMPLNPIASSTLPLATTGGNEDCTTSPENVHESDSPLLSIFSQGSSVTSSGTLSMITSSSQSASVLLSSDESSISDSGIQLFLTNGGLPSENVAVSPRGVEGGHSTCFTPLISIQKTSETKPRKLFPIFEKPITIATPKKRKLDGGDGGSPSGSGLKKPRLAVAKKKGPTKDSLEQLHLDLGQKTFGHVTCKVCGMVYTFGQAEDEMEHVKFHKKFISGVKFAGWRKERVIQELYDGRIILVLPTDPKHQLKKIEDLCRLVDTELGYASGATLGRNKTKVFLYVSTRKSIMGCIFAEEIKEGYRVVTSENRNPDSRDLDLSAWFCSTTPEPAILGINRMWVSSHFRRRSVATRLLDAVRASLISGCVIPREKVAFSDPTPAGRAFAAKYCRTNNFLVYRWT